MKAYLKYLLLFVVVLVAAVLRFYQLGSLPPSLEWDEAATGYDANSILRTGKDQYGHFLPLTFRSLDDYKPALYTYMAAGSIAIFGWNNFAVRFPAAFLGTLSILTTYAMVSVIFKNKKLALLSALILAISPWHINFSRLALETNSIIFFTTLGIWAFYKGLKDGKYLLLTAILFGLNLYLYHHARVFIPMLSVLLFVFYFKEVWAQKKYLLISVIIFAIFAIRLWPIVTSVEGKMRFDGASIFTTAVPLDIQKSLNDYARWRSYDTQYGLGIYGKLFDNDKVFYALRLLKNYISNLNPTFLLFTDDYPRHHVAEMGILYFIELPLFYLGWIFLKDKYGWKLTSLLLLWIAFGLIPGAVARDTPHALRSEIILPTVQIAIAAALLGIATYLKDKKLLRSGCIALFCLLYFLHVSFFLHKYLFHFARETSEYWQYGRRDAAIYADSVKDKYNKIIVSTTLEQPHIFFLYELRYDPQKYLAEGGTVSGGWAEDRNHFDKFQFKPFNYEKDRDPSTLFIGFPNDFPANVSVMKKIYYLNGTEALWIVSG